LNYKDASLELQLYDPKAEAFLKTQEYVHSQITTVGQTSKVWVVQTTAYKAEIDVK
jgi:HAE1 family hydrophobic/amphiphilic exporter-1